jgi:hypothetical protein
MRMGRNWDIGNKRKLPTTTEVARHKSENYYCLTFRHFTGKALSHLVGPKEKFIHKSLKCRPFPGAFGNPVPLPG